MRVIVTVAFETNPTEIESESRRRGLLDDEGALSSIERSSIRFVQRSFESERLDRATRFLQRHVGSTWIESAIRNLRHVEGAELLPKFDPAKSYLCVSNHRSFFDLYVITGYLVKRGMPHRLVFPVRSKFFYDQRLGLFVNGIMSFFAMYPPVFRERSRAALNLASLDEVARLLRRGGSFVGVHPEGTRNTSDDPYTLLPAQTGIGRIVRAARATVIPVFINGLGNDIVRQIGSNYTRTGKKVVMVFGEPIDFGNMLDATPSPRLHRQIAEHTLGVVHRLGQREREIRASISS